MNSRTAKLCRKVEHNKANIPAVKLIREELAGTTTSRRRAQLYRSLRKMAGRYLDVVVVIDDPLSKRAAQ